MIIPRKTWRSSAASATVGSMTTLSGTGATGSNRKPNTTCRKCGDRFWSHTGAKSFCSDRCRKKVYRSRLTDIPCEAGCGKMLTVSQAQFCSNKCRGDQARIEDKEGLLWSRINKRPDGHWEWGGTLDLATGRGWFNWTGMARRADRVVYELVRCKLPSSIGLERSCDLEGCVNPDHQRLLDPVARAEKAARTRKANQAGAAPGPLRRDRRGGRTIRPQSH